MRRNKFMLHIRPDTERICRAEKNAHLALTDFAEKLVFLLLRLHLLHKGDLFLGDARPDELCADVIVDVEAAAPLSGRRGLVAEDDLCPFVFHILAIGRKHIVDAAVDLAVRMIGQ